MNLGQMVVGIFGDSTQFESAVDRAQGKFNGLARSIAVSNADVAKSFKVIDGEMAVWGRSTDLIAQKQEVLKQQIRGLIASGVDPLDKSIEKLQNEYFKLGKESETLAKSQQTLKERTQALSASMVKTGQGLTLGVTLPLVGLGIAAVKSAADMEMLEASFTTMLGSAESAASLMNDIKKMASVTPFETTDLAQASKMLMQMGNLTKDEVIPALQMLGDASGGSAERFQRLAYTFSQMTSLGRLQGQDLRELINAGFNPLNEIAKKTGESMEALKDRMSKGGVSALEVKNAFIAATSEGGKFYKGMDTASKTLEGLLSTLKDDVATLGRSFVQDLMPFIKDTVKWLSGLAQQFSKLDPEAKKTVLVLVGIAAAIGPLLIGVGKLIGAIGNIQGALAKLPVAFTAAMGPIGLVLAAVTALSIALSAIGSWVREQEIKRLEKDFGALAKEIETAGGTVEGFIVKAENIEIALRGLDTNFTQILGTMQFIESKKTTSEMAESFKLMEPLVRSISDKYKVSAIEAVKIGLASSVLTPELKAQLTVYKEQLTIQQERIAGQLAMIEYDKQFFAKQAAEAATAAAKKVSDSEKEKQSYIDAAQVVQGIIDSQKTERQVLADKIIAIDKKTWKAGSELENNRLVARKIIADQIIAITQNETDQTALETGQAIANQIEDENMATDIRVQLAYDEYMRKRELKRKETELYIQTAQEVLSITGNMLSEIQNLNNVNMQNQLSIVEQIQSQALLANEKELQAKLQAAGVADKTAIESAQLELDEARKSGNAIAILEAEKALKKEEILAEYQKKEDAINKKAAVDKYNIELAQFNTNKAFSVGMAIIDTAAAIIKQIPNPWLMALAAGMGAIQIAAITAQMPPAPPALAEGGIVMPRVGGTLANIAEAGQPEIVFPLDKLNKFMGNTSTGNNGGDNIHLVVNLDSKPFLDKIFPATKNRTVLISSGAVV